MALPKGVSGNPGGRPKKTDAQKLFESRCREQLFAKGWPILVEMLTGGDKQDRRYAMDKMLEYGYLAPPKSIDITEYEPIDERSDQEIMDEIKQVLAGATGEAGKEPSTSEVSEGK